MGSDNFFKERERTMGNKNVLLGFRTKDPACRLIECNSGICANYCAGALVVDWKGRAVAGLGAGSQATLPKAVTPPKQDFLNGLTPWKSKDPHDGDWNDMALGL